MRNIQLAGAVLTLVFALGSRAHGADPRLRIEPAQPHPGGTLTVAYDPKGGPLEGSKTLTLVYGFAEFDNYRAGLQAKDGALVADVPIPSNAAYFWCWVEGKTADDRDMNRGGVWDTYLYNEKGLPVEDARVRREVVYWIRKQPLEVKTVELILLEEELRAYPANPVAWTRWWRLRYEDAGNTIAARDSILREIEQFYNANLDHPWAYRAAAGGYSWLRRDAKASDLMRAFMKRFPEDNSLDATILSYFQSSLADLERLPLASKRFESIPEYWEYMLYAYAAAHTERDKLLHAGRRWLALVPKERDTNGDVRFRVAETWLANNVDPVAAEGVAREAVAISELGSKSGYPAMFPSAAKHNRTVLCEVHRSALGWALFQEGNYEDALRELGQAAVVREKEKRMARALYSRLGQTLEKLRRPDDAMQAYLKELAWGADDKPTRAAITALYQKAHGNLDGLDAEIRSQVNDLVTQASLDSMEPIEDANEKPGRFDLRGPDGRAIQLDRYQGKIVLIEFWATWCGSCLVSMKHTQKLVQEFPGQIVVLAVSQDGEETRPRAPEYLKKMGYDFVLLFDDESRRDLWVPVVPARFLIDRNGLLRVRESGWSQLTESVFEKKLRGLM